MDQSWNIRAIDIPFGLRAMGVRIHAFSKNTPFASFRFEPSANSATMIFGIGSRWSFSASNSQYSHSSALYSGVATVPHQEKNDDLGTCLEVSLPPWLASGIVGHDLATTNVSIALADALGANGRSLVEQVANCSSLESAKRHLVRFLQQQISNDQNRLSKEIVWAWKRLSQDASNVSVSKLARDIGWSERHFSARFIESIGCNPKRSARLARFESAYFNVVESQLPLVDVASSTGYYDQSHMIRDFREFSALTPSGVRAQEAEHLVVTI